ncbi:MAG TPA: alpha/beta hydrolase [Pseudorhodoplanes sp.]|nr:alpha/beta hydrolase [Pseudorhodoplanes sp.]
MKSVTVNAHTRYYAEEGAGPPLVLVHGSMSSHRQWRSLADRLRDRYRVIAADLLACAPPGSRELGAFTFAQDCDFIRQLVEMNPGAHLLGHSYGGLVAIKAAMTSREKLSSLILMEPSCFHLLEQEKQPEYEEITSLRDQQRAHESRGEAAEAARVFIEYWIGPDAWTAMPARRKELMMLGVPKLNEDWPGTLEHQTRLADYSSLSLPTLLMRAKDTRRPSFRIVDLLHPVLPNATLVEIASGGHMSPLTNPEPVNEAVDRFLEDR